MSQAISASAIARFGLIALAAGALVACQPTAAGIEIDQPIETVDDGSDFDDGRDRDDRFGRDDRRDRDDRFDDERLRCTEFERANGEC
jgi:hypothetical protein